MIDLRERSDLNKTIPINTSPETSLQPVTRTQAGCPFRLKITSKDEDGDTVRCRFATGVENCGGVCGSLQAAGAMIDSVSGKTLYIVSLLLNYRLRIGFLRSYVGAQPRSERILRRGCDHRRF